VVGNANYLKDSGQEASFRSNHHHWVCTTAASPWPIKRAPSNGSWQTCLLQISKNSRIKGLSNSHDWSASSSSPQRHTLL